MSTMEGSVFTGSISELSEKKKPHHPIVQFCFFSEPHWIFALLFSHILFWTVGFQPDLERIYNDNHYNHDGGIPSGPSGSGVFVISVMLMVVATITVGVKAAYFKMP